MARQRLFEFPEGMDPSSAEGRAFKYQIRKSLGYYESRKSEGKTVHKKPLVLLSGDRASLELRNLLAYSCFIRIGDQEWNRDETDFPSDEMLEVMSKRLKSYYNAAYQREYQAKKASKRKYKDDPIKHAQWLEKYRARREKRKEQAEIESRLVWRGIHFD